MHDYWKKAPGSLLGSHGEPAQVLWVGEQALPFMVHNYWGTDRGSFLKAIRHSASSTAKL